MKSIHAFVMCAALTIGGACPALATPPGAGGSGGPSSPPSGPSDASTQCEACHDAFETQGYGCLVVYTACTLATDLPDNLCFALSQACMIAAEESLEKCLGKAAGSSVLPH